MSKRLVVKNKRAIGIFDDAHIQFSNLETNDYTAISGSEPVYAQSSALPCERVNPRDPILDSSLFKNAEEFSLYSSTQARRSGLRQLLARIIPIVLFFVSFYPVTIDQQTEFVPIEDLDTTLQEAAVSESGVLHAVSPSPLVKLGSAVRSLLLRDSENYVRALIDLEAYRNQFPEELFVDPDELGAYALGSFSPADLLKIGGWKIAAREIAATKEKPLSNLAFVYSKISGLRKLTLARLKAKTSTPLIGNEIYRMSAKTNPQILASSIWIAKWLEHGLKFAKNVRQPKKQVIAARLNAQMLRFAFWLELLNSVQGRSGFSMWRDSYLEFAKTLPASDTLILQFYADLVTQNTTDAKREFELRLSTLKQLDSAYLCDPLNSSLLRIWILETSHLAALVPKAKLPPISVFSECFVAARQFPTHLQTDDSMLRFLPSFDLAELRASQNLFEPKNIKTISASWQLWMHAALGGASPFSRELSLFAKSCPQANLNCNQAIFWNIQQAKDKLSYLNNHPIAKNKEEGLELEKWLVSEAIAKKQALGDDFDIESAINHFDSNTRSAIEWLKENQDLQAAP